MSVRSSMIPGLLVLFSAAIVPAAVCRDRHGDFDDSDVISVETDIAANRAVITITYADDQIGMATGAGGFISIDADQDPQTGQKDSPGFDRQITFNISQLAPMAELEFLAGPQAGQTVPIGAANGNGTNLQFNATTVRFTLPLQLVSTGRDFDYVLFASGMFSTGGEWDRVPDVGVVTASTGQPKKGQVPQAAAGRQQVITAPAGGAGNRLISRVTTKIDGANAIWLIDTTEDLPTNALDLYQSLSIRLQLDIDRRLATGIESADVPYLAFGPDRVIHCELVPGGRASIRIITGIAPNGERQTKGGGAGVNDLQATFTRRQIRIVVPLWLIDIRNDRFDWMLFAIKLDKPVDAFMGTCIGFDNGRPEAPLAMPAHAVSCNDPEDARTIETRTNTGGIHRAKLVPPPNTELRQLRAALTPSYLIMRINYGNGIVMQPEYLTSVEIQTATNPPRNYLLTINFHAVRGVQAVLRSMPPARDFITPTFLNQCVVADGKNAHMLLPADAFGLQRFNNLKLAVSTYEVRMDPDATKRNPPGIMYHSQPRPTTQAEDRLPDTGYVQLSAQ